MIAACPTCGARYRIDTAKLRPEGARLRCSRCENVFRVRAPEGAVPAAPAEAVAAPPVPQPAPPAARAPAPVAGEAAGPPARAPAPVAAQAAAPQPSAEAADAAGLVLVAHPEVEQGKQIADALASWGLRTVLVHDGVEAILNIQRLLPRLVILDAALPKMFGFQVCELMKRNESLSTIHVVLVGAIHDQDRYRRPPGELYGADDYIERQNLPEGLVPLLERSGLSGSARVQQPERQIPPPRVEPRPETPAPRQEDPRPAAQQPLAPAPAPAVPAPAPAPADPALAAEVEQADRLARIIVSDIVLYNPEKFEAGLQSGDVLGALASELAEGRALFAQRVDPRVGAAEDFLQRELLRVARSRGMP